MAPGRGEGAEVKEVPGESKDKQIGNGRHVMPSEQFWEKPVWVLFGLYPLNAPGPPAETWEASTHPWGA